MWSPQKFPEEDVILKRNEGVEGELDRAREPMLRFDLSSS